MIPTNEQLSQLIRENPALPLMHLVSFDVVGRPEGWWLAEIERAAVEEYWQDPPTGSIYFRHEQDDILGVLCERNDYASEAAAMAALNSLPWQKAIIMHIVPEVQIEGVKHGRL